MRQYKKYLAGIWILLCLLFLVGCGKGNEPEEGDTFICYVDTEKTALVKEAYEVHSEKAEGQVTEYLEGMMAEPDSIDYKSVFSFAGGIMAPDQRLSDGNLDLYFDYDYKEMKAGEEVLFRAAVVQTLTQIEGVDYIEFYVDDQPLSDQDGRVVGYMCADDFVQNTGSSLAYQTTELKLYFANEKGNMLVPEEVSVRYDNNTQMEKLIVEQLIKGSRTEGNLPVIPSETKVLGVSVKDGVCYVNLDEGFLNNTYGVDPKITVYAIVNSIVDGGSSGQVQISVNGESNIQYMGSIDLSKPLSRDLDLVY